MHQPTILLVDGSQPGDADLAPILAVLRDTLARSARIQTLVLRDMKLGHCVGCFGCWLKTPGQCVQPDSGREIARAILNSDTTVLFSPLMFGSYSPELKRMVDRCLSPLNLPYLQVSHGETHHEPRYDRYPRLVGVGVQRQPQPEEAALFKLIVGRNALQFHAPSHAAEVVTVADPAEALQDRFQALLARIDPLPHPQTVRELCTELSASTAGAGSALSECRALLLTGSPKAIPSTSAALGGYLMQRLAERGWQTENMKLRAHLRQPEAQSQLLAAVDRADLIVLAYPLYNDALPYLVTCTLQLIGRRLSKPLRRRPQRLVVISNNGFPEPHHNLPAISICRRFAETAGLDWAGGLAVGGGEALSAGQPLHQIRRVLPPVKHVMRALDLAAEALSDGQGVPDKAANLIARNPIHPAPFASYRWIFRRKAARRWEREAAENGVALASLRAQPYRELTIE
jgi:multimeric flavodoxin WrbA